MHLDNLLKKAQLQSKSRRLSCTFHKQVDKMNHTMMEHKSAVAAETKASSFIRLIKKL